MNPETPNNPRAEMEPRLTALLLGELNAEEAAAVHQAMQQDAELAKLFARLHRTVGLVREAVKSSGEPVAKTGPLKLSTARREELLAQFKTVTPKEFTERKPLVRPSFLAVAAMLALMALLAAMLLPALNRAKNRGMSSRRYAESAHSVDVLSAPDSGVDSTPADVANSGSLGEPTAAMPAAIEEKRPVGVTPLKSGSSTIVLPGNTDGDADSKIAANNEGVVAGYDSPESSQPVANGFMYRNAYAAPSGGVTDDSKSEGKTIALGDSPTLGHVFYRVSPDSGGVGGLANSKSDKVAEVPAAILPPVPLVSPAEVTKEYEANTSLTESAPIAAGAYLPSVRGYYDDQAQSQPFGSQAGRFKVGSSESGSVRGLTKAESDKLAEVNLAPPATLAAPAAGSIELQGSTSIPEPKQKLKIREIPVQSERFEQAVTDAGVRITTGIAAAEKSELEGLAKKPATDSLAEVNSAPVPVPPTITTKAKFAEVAQNDGRAEGFDWHFRNKPEIKASGGSEPALNARFGEFKGGALAESGYINGAPVGGRGSSLGVPRVSGAVAGGQGGGGAAGDSLNMNVLNVGQEFLSSDQRKDVQLLTGVAGKRSENVFGLGVVGDAATPIQETSKRNGRDREAGRAKVEVIADLPPASPEPVATANDGLLTAGLRTVTNRVAFAVDGLGSANRAGTSVLEEKRRQLQDEEDVRRLLVRKINIEKTDLSLPKSSQVEIIENATADEPANKGVVESMRRSLGGQTRRTASLKLERDKSDVSELSASSASAYDPYFIQTEQETIGSEAVLGPAVDSLKLDQRWGKAGGKLPRGEAIARLRSQLESQPRRNTSIVDIRASGADSKEAADIANAVASSYKHFRQTRGEALTHGGIVELEKAMSQQDEKIAQLKQELKQLSDNLDVAAVDVAVRKPATNAPIPQPEILTAENNFSTFSLNVSDVSFKLAAASLEQGQMPDPASVRSEEFINAFDYRDPEPGPGAPIAFAWERARYPFAVNRDLLRFSLKTAAAGRQAGRPLNIVLLLDNSGSMERADRVQIIREALRVLASQLQPQDKLSVITFARTARLVADGIVGDKAGEVMNEVGGLTPQGGTNLEEAMNLAYETAARHYLLNGINRVVVLTDGAANLGDVEPTSLKQKVETARRQGIALDCFGIGWEGFNDDLLEALSRNGDGRYGFINSPEAAATDFAGQLAGALKVAASDVKVQVEFNPARVTSYRQIGYAKHQLTKEQFRDNTVDAAEIAAQEAGNALYTVEVNPGGSGPLCTVRVRYKIPGTTDYREQAWEVPYTGNAPALEQSSPAMRLAASAAAFAEWLVASPFAGDVSPDAVLGYLRGVPEVFGADSRPKKLEWMIRQAKSIDGH